VVVCPGEQDRRSGKRAIHQFTSQVVGNVPVTSSVRRLDLLLPPSASFEILPGQFFMIRTGMTLWPLLRRPFSILSSDPPGHGKKRRVSILFRVVGQGTRLMAEWQRGQSVDMIGPLGRGYTLPESSGTVLMLAGGLGIASLFGLAESILLKQGAPLVWVCIGGKTGEEILMKSELEEMGAEVEVTTEDGSMGMHGLLTQWLERLDTQMRMAALTKSPGLAVYACGPFEMLARVAAITRMLPLPCQVSLEARMACGVGACLGCAVKTRQRGYQMVCKAGPVFDAREIDWEATCRLF